MEKTISINIGGIIFHIEEEGYQRLRSYLNSIHKYFSAFADNKEILSDIEGRIAERFLLKMKTGGIQVISLSDVEELITAMGTVDDFAAIEYADDLLDTPAEPVHEFKRTEAEASEPETSGRGGTQGGDSKFYRDLRRKILGGVAAGLAHRFSIDPVWIRLMIIFLIVGLPVSGKLLEIRLGGFGYIAATTVLVYIAMWIAFPGSATLEEDKKIKKFFRDPDKKVIGGVAAGVSSYFAVDLGVVRFLWVLSVLFFGTGVIIYLVLWVIAPAARTLTEKMEMVGEPITLSNIETNIKKGLDLDEKSGEERLLTKVLLFPFRALSVLLGGLADLLKGLGPVVRVLIGVCLVFVGTLAILACVILLGLVLFLNNSTVFSETPFQIMREIPGTLLFSAAVSFILPFVLLLLLGIALLSKRRVVGPSVWLSTVGIWIVGVIATSVAGIAYATNFSRKGRFESTQSYPMPARMLWLDVRELDEETIDNDISVSIVGFDAGDSLKIEKKTYAKGRSISDGRRIAEQIQYDAMIRDSVLYFDDGLRLADKTFFRDQSVDIHLFVPYEKPFGMSRDFYVSKLSKWGDGAKNLSRYELRSSEVDWRKLRWVVKRETGLECINIPSELVKASEDEEVYGQGQPERGDFTLGPRGAFVKHFVLEKFDSVVLNGSYNTRIEWGSQFGISADGDEADVDHLAFRVKNGVLSVESMGKEGFWERGKRKRIGLLITMPELKSLELGGATRTKVSGFRHASTLEVSVSGAAMAEVDVEVARLKLDLSGASKAILKGQAKELEADLSGACRLDANAMDIRMASVDASGASRARLGEIPDLRQNADGVSRIDVEPK